MSFNLILSILPVTVATGPTALPCLSLLVLSPLFSVRAGFDCTIRVGRCSPCTVDERVPFDSR